MYIDFHYYNCFNRNHNTIYLFVYLFIYLFLELILLTLNCQ